MCMGVTKDIILTPGKVIKMGEECSLKEMVKYTLLFQEFHDAFVWDYTNIKGIDPSIITYNLTTIPGAHSM